MGFFKRDPDGPPSYSGPPAGGPVQEIKGSSRLSYGGAPPQQQQMMAAGPSGPGPQYACVMLSQSDRVRLLNFPPNIVDVVRHTLSVAWPIGVQKEHPLPDWANNAYEFKLRGSPWYGQGHEAVPSKRLMIHLLHALSNAGWHLAASIDMSKKSRDKDSLVFRAGPPLNRLMFSVTFNESDKVRIIDPPSPEIKQAFMNVVQQWPFGIQAQKEKEQGCYQFKLRGNPWWSSNGAQVSQARLLSLNLLSMFDQMGYELMATIDMNMSGGEDSSGDMDAWFFGAKFY